MTSWVKVFKPRFFLMKRLITLFHYIYYCCLRTNELLVFIWIENFGGVWCSVCQVSIILAWDRSIDRWWGAHHRDRAFVLRRSTILLRSKIISIKNVVDFLQNKAFAAVAVRECVQEAARYARNCCGMRGSGWQAYRLCLNPPG